MFLDGGKLDHECCGDLLIGGTCCQQAQDFLLTLGQWLDAGRCGRSNAPWNRRCVSGLGQRVMESVLFF
jgi:hypothetical protein